MADVFDVAEYILGKIGFASTMKLQKLAFYSQALSLVEADEPLFPEHFQAWVNGPVCYELFSRHRGKYIVGPGDICEGSRNALDGRSTVFVDRVINVLGDLSGQQLSELTHGENPWLDARAGCESHDRCDTEIPNKAIRSFYSSAACRNPLFCAQC